MSAEQDTQVQIRRAEVEDAAGIAHVRVTSWRATYRGIVPQEVLEDLSVDEASRWLSNMIQSNARGSCYFVAEAKAGQIVGFALGGPERTQDPVYESELYAIYILPGFLRSGIGRRLLVSLSSCLSAQGFQSMLVWVLAENPSRIFYEDMGGVYVREQPITIGQATLMEVAYGWKDLRKLLSPMQE